MFLTDVTASVVILSVQHPGYTPRISQYLHGELGISVEGEHASRILCQEGLG